MFDKDIELTIMTRLENEDNFKIEKLVSACRNPGKPTTVKALKNGEVKIGFITSKSCVKKIKEHLALLNFVGIKGELEIV